MRDFLDEFFEKDTTGFNELRIITILHFHVANIHLVSYLFRDRWNIAARPSINKRFIKCLKFIESSLTREVSGRIATSHSILGDFPYFLGISDRKLLCSLLSYVLLLFRSIIYLITDFPE